MIPSSEDIVLFLKGARGFIERGWCTRTPHKVLDGVDHYCASGALYVQRGEPQWSELDSRNNADLYQAALAVLQDAAFREIGARLGRGAHLIGLGSVVFFNDQVANSKSDVLALYDRAISSISTAAMKEEQ